MTTEADAQKSGYDTKEVTNQSCPPPHYMSGERSGVDQSNPPPYVTAYRPYAPAGGMPMYPPQQLAGTSVSYGAQQPATTGMPGYGQQPAYAAQVQQPAYAAQVQQPAYAAQVQQPLMGAAGYGPQPVVYMPVTRTRPFGSGLMLAAICATFCCCMPIGCFAIWFAYEADQKFLRGDDLGSIQCAQRSKQLSGASIVTGTVLFVVIIVFYSLQLFNVFSSYRY